MRKSHPALEEERQREKDRKSRDNFDLPFPHVKSEGRSRVDSGARKVEGRFKFKFLWGESSRRTRIKFPVVSALGPCTIGSSCLERDLIEAPTTVQKYNTCHLYAFDQLNSRQDVKELFCATIGSIYSSC